MKAGAWVPLGMSCPLDRKPFSTDSRKLISSAGQYLQSNLCGMFFNFCVCVFVVDKPVVCVDVEPVPCTKASMELFDPIYSCGILRPSGHVVKCFHDVYPDYDELRQVNFLITSLSLSIFYIFFDMESVQVFLCSSSRCYRMRTLSTTMWLGERSEGSFCFASSSTCVSEESSVSTKTPLILISVPQSTSTETWSGGQNLCRHAWIHTVQLYKHFDYWSGLPAASLLDTSWSNNDFVILPFTT